MAATLLSARPLERQSCSYTSCYCEENVYKLLQSLITSSTRAEHLYALFISNSNESIPLWQQKSSQQEDGLVVWDYHVIVLEVHVQQPAAFVWDLDTRLPFPCSFQEYVHEALRADQYILAPKYARWYRVVTAESFLQHFASDRSHMRAQDDSWLKPPPAYQCITAADGCTNNLRLYRNMHTDRLQELAAGLRQYNSTQGLQEQQQMSMAEQQATTDADQRDSTIGVGGSERGNEQEAVVPSWQAIHDLAVKQKYGVVVNEQQLLCSLLGT